MKKTTTYLFLIMFSMLVYPCIGSAKEQTENLMLWYKLNDGKGTTIVKDYSGNGFNGRLHDHVAEAEKINAGIIDADKGCVVGFEKLNANKIICSKPNMTAGTAARTIAFWVKITPESSQAGAQLVLSGGETEGYGKLLIMLNESKNIRLLLKGSTSSINFAGTQNLLDSRWHHMALTVPEGGLIDNIKFYLDGNEIITKTLIGITAGEFINTTDGSYVLGHNFIGNMSDFRVYNKELSAFQVRNIYNENPQMVLHYPMNDSKFTTLQNTQNIVDMAAGTTGTLPNLNPVINQYLKVRVTGSDMEGTDICNVTGGTVSKNVLRLNDGNVISGATPISRNALLQGKFDITGGAERTTSLWLKFDKDVVLDAGSFINIFSYGTTDCWRLLYALNSASVGYLRVVIKNEVFVDFTLPANLHDDNIWHNLVVVLEGGSTTDHIKLYLDGEIMEVFKKPDLPITLNTINGQISLGKDFRGWMSEFKMFRGAFSAERIASDFKQKPTVALNRQNMLETDCLSPQWINNLGDIPTANNMLYNPTDAYGEYQVKGIHPYLGIYVGSDLYMYRPEALSIKLEAGKITSNFKDVSHKWFRDGVEIENQVGPTLEPTHTGVYHAIYTINGIDSHPSNLVEVTEITEINETQLHNHIKVAVLDKKLIIISLNDAISNISIINMNGTIVEQIPNIQENDCISLDGLSAGLYFVRINNSIIKILL